MPITDDGIPEPTETFTIELSSPVDAWLGETVSHEVTILDDEAADLEVTKTDGPDPVRVGEVLSYFLTVTNLGPDPAPAFVVSDTLPAGTVIATTSGAISWRWIKLSSTNCNAA